ncbi:hypothetical protein [Lutimonas vermicola]|uniref:Peptidase M10 metallopeptidase domain-containing protein n=1 Tax=Lutimonas vermicola TaxID=414288 RepID=A0ABU9L3Y1_9FLAO
MNLKNYFMVAAIGLGAMSCQTSDSDVELDTNLGKSSTPRSMQKTEAVHLNLNRKPATKGESSPMDFMVVINQALQSQGISVQLSVIESYGSDGTGNTVYFNDRGNKQLAADFVPFDPNRGGFSDIAYARDGTEGFTSSGLSQIDTDGAILNAMNTWNNVSCSSGLVLTNLGASPFDLGYVQAIVSGGASGSFFFTDIMHSGFNTEVTDAVFGPGSNVLGVTFTFIWGDYDENGDFIPSDIDNNRKNDVAFRDIYYNDAYPWSVDGSGIDVETVVLHESGHGLSQAHFGKLFQGEKNEKFHFAPRALMNAGYTGIQRTIGESDNAGHCSNWAQWPNN